MLFACLFCFLLVLCVCFVCFEEGNSHWKRGGLKGEIIRQFIITAIPGVCWKPYDLHCPGFPHSALQPSLV